MLWSRRFGAFGVKTTRVARARTRDGRRRRAVARVDERAMVDARDALVALAIGAEVWITSDGKDGDAATHLPGVVASVRDDGRACGVKVEGEDGERECDAGEVLMRERATAEDMVKLNHLHEPGVLENLRARYATDDIYTYTGSILIAVNPFKDVGHLYDEHMMSMYRGARLGDLSPHVYATADAAYEALRTEGVSQSVLVSGESGAGKTETAKLLMRYIAHRSSSDEDAGGGRTTQDKVLESNPLLEAFGNAKTVRNDNSSRFGKYVELQFDSKYRISGAAIRTYLLERSRVVKTSDPERNFHIFYQLCAGAEESDRETWRLKDASAYNYTNQSACFDLDGLDNSEEYRRTMNAMDVVGITKAEQKSIMSVVAGILHLGNICFIDNTDDEGCDFASDAAKGALVDCAAVLKLDAEKLERSLRTRRIVLADEVIHKPLSAAAATHSRDALAKSLYSKLFDSLVDRINISIGQDATSKAFIGVLDIYGFESFAVNSFEQFCINFANEKLQQHFNQHVFKMEQEEYEREGIDWSYIEFIDNQDMLDVIERRSNGIISLLDESCMLASSTDEQFAQKLYTGLKDEQRLSKPKLSQTAFTLSHYAGDVTYESNTFLDKNKDFVIQEHEEILASGSHEELVRMFALGDDSSETSGRGKSSTKFSSVSTRFKKQLGELMSKLNATEPHYIRCIKPNAASKASSFEGANVLQQLRCGGVLEAIRISCAGYPSRKPIEIFLARFGLLAPQAAALYFEGREREALEGILQAANVDGWQIGKTQVFLRSGQMAILDVLRLNKLNKAAIEIQSRARAFVKRKQFTELRSASIKVAAAARGMLARKRVRSIREQIAAVRIQTAFRAIRARVQFERTKDAVQKIQAIVRGARARQILRQTRATEITTNKAATCIQSHWKAKVARKEFKVAKARARETGALLEAKSSLEQQLESERARTAMEQRARQDENARHASMEQELRARMETLEKELAIARESVHGIVESRVSEVTSQKDGEINVLRQSLVERDAKLAELQEWKATREAQFAELNSKLEAIHLDSLASPAKHSIATGEATIASASSSALGDLNTRISEKIELNSKLRQENDSLQQERTDLERVVNQLRTEMSEMEKENATMKSQCSPSPVRTGGRFASILSPMSPMDGLDTLESPRTPETPNSEDVEAALEREQAELDARKLKLEQVRSHMEYAVLLNFIEKDARDAGFMENGTPVLACIIFRCLLKWGTFELDRTSLFDKIMDAINISLEDAGEDYAALTYWLTNAFILLQLLQRTLKTTASGSKENRRKSGGLFDRLNSRFVRATTPVSTSSPGVKGVSHIDAKYPAFLFKQQLAALVEKIYGTLRDRVKKDVTPQFATCIQAPRQRSGTATLTRSASGVLRPELGQGWMRILDTLDETVKAMALNNVPQALSKRFFVQVFCFINVQMFNALLLRRECCSFSNGEYIKMGLSLFDSWARKPQNEAVGEDSLDELRFIRQAVNLLVIHQKPQKTLNEITLELCPQLSIQQLYRISTMYWDDKYGTESVNAEVLSEMRIRMKEDNSSHASNSFLLDDDSSVQFSIDENLDAQAISIQLDGGFGLPGTFLENPSFAFLLARPSEQ